METEYQVSTDEGQTGLGSAERFERACAWVSGFAQRRQTLLLAVYSACFLTYFLWMDLYRDMWSDEFYSLYISRLPLSEMWKAILTGADQHPPLYYFLTHVCLRLFGENQFVVRLSATLGFLVMTLCVFRITASRVPAVFAFVAMVFPLLTGAIYYAQEGRGYGLVLGFLSLALLCWQMATDEHRVRGLCLAGLALSLSMAVGSHYYAVFALVPLAAGEISRSIVTRRLDWPIWMAFSAPLVTVLASLPAIQSARMYGPNFWAVPLMRYAGDYFHIMFHESVVPIVAAVILLTGYSHWSKGPRLKAAGHREGLRTHELVALATVTALPVVIIVAAKIGTGGFHPRYVLFPIVGFSVLMAASIAAVSNHRAVVGVVILTLCIAWMSVKVSTRLSQAGPVSAGSEYSFLRETGNAALPIVVSESSVLFHVSYYAPADIAKRIVYLADTEASLEFLKHDTVDKGLLALRPWFPLNVQPYRDYLCSRREFLVYGLMDGNWNWLMSAFARDKIPISILGARGNRVMLHVRLPESAATYPNPSSVPQQAAPNLLCRSGEVAQSHESLNHSR